MTLSGGARLGPYEVVELLGAGGMGEVYRARDPRLGRDVAIKVLPAEVASDPDRLRRFEQEARAVAALNHPNILSVYDVGTQRVEQGPEAGEASAAVPYVVTELLEGENLRELVSRRSPTVKQVLGYALQAARGLEAAHARGIVHRDLKPENLFLTTDGRVKILDFGLAKLVRREELRTEAPTPSRSTAAGLVVGTVAYMSPEQARGQPVDPRSDVFSFGVVLYELLARRHPFRKDTAAATLTALVEETPAALESLSLGIPAAVGGIVRRCLEKDRQERYGSGHDVAMVLEAVLAAPPGSAALRDVEERSPYPGLSSFTEKDAAVFFGREHEVERLWDRIRSRKLLAVIGPSGGGKTSFVHAGVLPARPEGWAAIVCAPGRAPMRALARAVAPELAGDSEALVRLPDFEELDVAVSLLAKWRHAHAEALVVVDQFEELFTQNPPEVQQSFAELLGRLTKEADIHVLLSLRDDFLMRCHAHEPLARVFSELTPLDALTREGLRQAVTEPAKSRGYAFEDDALVGEMLDAVEGARGALPLLAFAVSRLWEKRDREAKRLTREAYEAIGGVAGALAQHAEQTLERIGGERQGMVREVFRNLVTFQGTRASSDREELLSVFPERGAAEEVLRELIDARLLTSYEVSEAGGPGPGEPGDGTAESQHRIEVVHESLLKAWPRLVHWQTQDEEGAQLRDELRQAAQMWDQHARSEDLLWSGTAFREFTLWRERYPGALTATEEAFAVAMTRQAQRRRRRRRLAAASAFVLLLAVLLIIGGFWRRSVAEARRAEAAGLFSLAQHRLVDHPTEALAYATASLERADDAPVRQLALEALWRGPTEFRLPAPSGLGIDFSPDGRWLAARRGPQLGGGAALWPSDGGPPTPLEGSNVTMELRFSPSGDLVAAQIDKERLTLGLWSVPEGRLLRTFRVGDEGQTLLFRLSSDSRRLLACRLQAEGRRGEIDCRVWPIGGGEPQVLARLDIPFESAVVIPAVDLAWTRFAWADGRTARITRLQDGKIDDSAVQQVGHDRALTNVLLDDQGRTLLAASDMGKSIRIWSLDRDPPRLIRTLTGPELGSDFRFDPSGWRLASNTRLWDLTAPPDAEPLRLQGCEWALAFHPEGRWLATTGGPSCSQVSLWPLTRPYPRVLTGHAKAVTGLAFAPDGSRLVSTSFDGTVRLWSLSDAGGKRSRVLHRVEGAFQFFPELAMAPDGSFVAAGNNVGQVVVLPLDGGPLRELTGFTDVISSVAVGPGGRLVAAGAGGFYREQALVRVWDLKTGEARILDAGDDAAVVPLKFTDAGQLQVLSRGANVIRRWDLTGATPRILDEIDLSRPEFGGGRFLGLTPDGREILLSKEGRRWIEDLETHATRDVIPTGTVLYSLGFDPTGRLVLSTDARGVVRVGSARGGEPHLLLGHKGDVNAVTVSPDGQWIASGGDDGTVRLWPMPDLSKPPLHTLPRQELLAKLRSLTNLRAVRDPGSATGWKIEAGPFPGWEAVPTW